MGSKTTVEKNLNSSNKIVVDVDTDQLNETITNVIVSSAQEITKKIINESNVGNIITIENVVTNGDFEIGPINMTIDSAVSIQAFTENKIDNTFISKFTQSIKDSIANSLQGTVGQDVIDKFKNNVTTSSDVLPALTSSDTKATLNIDSKLATRISTLITDCFTDCFESDARQILNESISNKIVTENRLTIRNIVVNGKFRFAGANLSIASNVIFKVVSKSQLSNLVIHEIGNSLNNIVDIKSSQNANTKLDEEFDNSVKNSTSIKGLTDMVKSILALPTNLTITIVFGVVAVVAIIGVVIVFVTKYLFGSPEAVQALAGVAGKFAGKGDDENTLDIVKNMLNSNSIIQDPTLLIS